MKIEISLKEFVSAFWLAVFLYILLTDLPPLEGVALLLLWGYFGAHLFYGPLDWYLIYKGLKKLMEVNK